MQEYIVVSQLDPAIQGQIISLLSAQGRLVTVAATPDALRKQLARHGPPALFIGNAGSMGRDGAAYAAALNGAGGARRLAVLSEADETTMQPEAYLSLEADDFVLWPATEAELTLRVARLLESRRGQAASGVPQPMGLGPGQQDGWRNDSLDHLSKTERAIIRRLAAAQGQPVPAEQLAECVASPGPEQRLNTLRVHVSRLRAKLEPEPNQPRYILTVRGVGYRLAAAESVNN